jgi:integrase
MRGCDLDRSVTPWVYRPHRHKTEHRGHVRVVPLGPRARAIVARYLEGRPPEAYLFSPAEAERARNARRTLARQSKRPPSQLARRPKRVRDRPWRERYDRDSYRRAVTRACKLAGVPVWTPNQLRHTMGTEVRKLDGIESVRTVLGHRSPAVSEVYAERDLERAMRIVEQIG